MEPTQPPDDEISAVADDETAPQEATGSDEAPYKRPARQNHTIRGLRLDIVAAEAGKTYLLLPYDVRGDYAAADAYPLPGNIGELARIAELPLRRNGRHGGARYIRRARKAMLRRATHIKAVDLDMSRAECSEKALQVAKAAADARATMDEAVAGVRAEALKSVASMGDINEKLKQAADRIVTAFLADQPINGEPVTVKEMSDVIGKGWTHVARLGSGVIDGDGKQESEATIISEFNQATRDRLAKQMAAPVDPKEAKH